MNQKILEGMILDEQTELSLQELCRACSSTEEWVIELVEEGVIEPVGHSVQRGPSTQWRFTAISLHRARIAKRLQHDLEINLSGAALALDLLNEIETLQSRLNRFEVGDK